MVVTDKPLLELGLLNATLEALKGHGVAVHIYDGVLPDPTQKVVNDGIAVLQQHNCDSVLAFGGGSSIDAAKVIALAAGNGCQAADCEGPTNALCRAYLYLPFPLPLVPARRRRLSR